MGAKDDFFNRHIIKLKLFEPIMQLFIANGNKYNLLNSAILELIDYIRKVHLDVSAPFSVVRHNIAQL